MVVCLVNSSLHTQQPSTLQWRRFRTASRFHSFYLFPIYLRRASACSIHGAPRTAAGPIPDVSPARCDAVPNATSFLLQMRMPALPPPIWLSAFDGWLAMAAVLLEGQLVDADRNRFLLDLLGAEGKRLVDWDACTTETEVNTATHADFRSTIQLRL